MSRYSVTEVSTRFVKLFFLLLCTSPDLYGVPFAKILYLTDLAQNLLSLHIFSYLCVHLAISACI